MIRNPKGTLIPVGGAEVKHEEEVPDNNPAKFYELGILKCILNEIPDGEEHRIEVITTATADPDEVFENYRSGFEKLNCAYIGHFNIRSRAEADDEKILARLEAANCVMISGGDQLRLSSTFGGTRFLRRLRERYERSPFVVAGTSAGAMVMSNPMIYAGRAEKANLKGEVKIVSGFGLVDDVIIDTHFDARGRFSRLAQAVSAQPGALGIGLGEDTGVIIKNGHLLQAIGSSSVILIDATGIVCTNIAEICEGEPITVQGLMVHILAAGDRYDALKRSFPKAKPELTAA